MSSLQSEVDNKGNISCILQNFKPNITYKWRNFCLTSCKYSSKIDDVMTHPNKNISH